MKAATTSVEDAARPIREVPEAARHGVLHGVGESHEQGEVVDVQLGRLALAEHAEADHEEDEHDQRLDRLHGHPVGRDRRQAVGDGKQRRDHGSRSPR
jgi:hypothetical protein